MACKWSKIAKVNRSYKLNLAISYTKGKKWAESVFFFLIMQQNLRKIMKFWRIFLKIHLFRFPHYNNILFFHSMTNNDHQNTFCNFILFIFNLLKFTQKFCLE